MMNAKYTLTQRILCHRTKFCILNSAFFILLSLQASAQHQELNDRNEGDTVVINKKSYIIHKCQKGETVFSIAAKYHVSVNDLDNANKDIINNLKKNTVLLIPVSKKKEEVKKDEPKMILPKDIIYKIVLLIPFNENKNYTADSTLANGNFLNGTLERETTASLEFYEGVLTAVDFLKMKGFKARLSVIDVFDSASVTKVKLKTEVKDADIIITNLGQNLAVLLSNYAATDKPVIISCGINTSASLKGNSNSFFTSPASLLQCQQMGEYYKKESSKKDKFISITTSLPKEMERANAFNNAVANDNELTINKVKLDSATQPLKLKVSQFLSKGNNNIIFVPTTDEAFASNVISYLKTMSAEFEFTLVGLPTWQYFQSVNPEDLQLLHTTIFSAVDISYESSSVVAFRKSFRDKYFTEPSENAFVGYDAMLFFGEELLSHGINFSKHLIDKDFKGLSTSFRFVKEQGSNGFENNYISVLRFEDYALKKINR